MRILNLYIIHSTHLINRVKYMNSSIEIIKKIANENSIDVKFIFIKEPTKDFIESNIDIYNKNVKYEKEEGENADEQFNNMINTLNANQISNIEKHREVLKNINNNDELHFIIEDDVLVGEEYVSNINELFKNFSNNEMLNWDILFTCLSSIKGDKQLSLVSSREQYKFLLNKSSYFIKADTSKKLYEYLEIYKYNLKTSISKFIWNNKEIKSCVLNKHTFLEGSKIGIFPSSLNSSNFLFQNMNFVEIAKLTNVDKITDDIINKALEYYKRNENMGSPDIIHSMGVLYYKKGDYENAKKYMTLACEKMKSEYGLITRASEILNNAINIYQYDQNMLEECKKKQPKYNSLSSYV